MKKLLVVLALCCFGCADESTEVEIRVRNISQVIYNDVSVNTSGGEGFYASILPGEYSDYATYAFAYRIAQISVTIDGTVYTLQPTDYVGESKLASGSYTYEVDFETSLSMTLVDD